MALYGRRTRLGLLALLIVTVLFASGALFVKFKLESLRGTVKEAIESRTGAHIGVGAVVVNGLRGLRLDSLDATYAIPGGPTVQFAAPVTYIHINLVDLLSGIVSVERIEADDATLHLSGSPDQPWFASAGGGDAAKVLSVPAFRLLGRRGTFQVDNLLGPAPLVISDFDFDVARMAGSPDIFAKLSGNLNGKDDEGVKVDLRYTAIEDFDLRVQSDAFTADDIAAFFPGAERFVKSGRFSPSVRLAGFPGDTLVIDFKTPFQDVSLRDQPNFIRPSEGLLSGVASYDSGRRVLTLTTARAESDQLAGRLEGSIAFDGPIPRLDLRLDATRLPVTEALSYIIKERADAYGVYDFKLEEPYQVYLTLKGPADAPEISFHGNAAAGAFSLASKDTAFPQCKLQLGAIGLAWDSQSTTPSGSLAIAGGTLVDGTTGLAAAKLSGILAIDNKHFSIDPLNMEVTGNPFVGRLKYDLDTRKLEASLSGTLAAIENTPLNNAISNLSLAGAANIRCALTRNASQYVIDAEVDATRTEAVYRGWLNKPSGVGASAKKLHVEIDPANAISITAEGDVATSPFSVDAKLVRRKNKWALQTADAVSKRIDIESIGRLIKIPYTVSGGAIANSKFGWHRTEGDGLQWQALFTGDIDRFALHPEGGASPVSGEDVRLEVAIASEPQPSGVLKLHAKEAKVPPLREKWFAAFKPDEAFSAARRPWTLELAVDALELPPWKGTEFKGTAYTNATETGIKDFGAKIDGGGSVEGTYHSTKLDNAYDMRFVWDGIPAWRLLEQLNYPRILNGVTTGEVAYSLDRDDPNTLKGQGRFEIDDGQFSADFLVSQLQGKLENKISALPPSLRFSLLKSSLAFERDTFTTPDLQLESEGIKISGSGSFITHGDMDYDLKVAVSPAIAEKIPALRDNFNIQGLRLAQQDIELAFKVRGPLFNPQGELEGLPPPGVTLVSSALEVTSDAMKVIDIPRRILTDLIKIGGGLVGMP